jgi:hypothetical protein
VFINKNTVPDLYEKILLNVEFDISINLELETRKKQPSNESIDFSNELYTLTKGQFISFTSNKSRLILSKFEYRKLFFEFNWKLTTVKLEIAKLDTIN